VDPYMRATLNSIKLGDTMVGAQVATVVESRNPKYPEGTKVVGNYGWRDMTVYNPTKGNVIDTYKLPDMKGLSDSYALGSIGMPGNTAYFGLTRILEPKPGDVLVVSSAAGAVGSLVGQIGKLKGCTVLAFAGSDDKLKWMKDDLQFDHVFNYKKVKANDAFKEFAPKGINLYFDNVGGEFTCNVMRHLKPYGRIAVCGAIATYNSEQRGPPVVPMDYLSLIYKNLRMEGFVVYQWLNEWMDGLHQMRDWIHEGKIKVHETVSDGFETMPQAFIDLLDGKNIGKQIIKA